MPIHHSRQQVKGPCRCASRRCKPEASTYTLAKEVNMPKFLIEREIRGAGALSPQEFQGIAEKSCSVLRNLGPQIQWVHSYVTDNKIYCVYIAPNEEMVREHATRGGFPAQPYLRNQDDHRSNDRGELRIALSVAEITSTGCCRP